MGGNCLRKEGKAGRGPAGNRPWRARPLCERDEKEKERILKLRCREFEGEVRALGSSRDISKRHLLLGLLEGIGGDEKRHAELAGPISECYLDLVYHGVEELGRYDLVLEAIAADRKFGGVDTCFERMATDAHISILLERLVELHASPYYAVSTLGEELLSLVGELGELDDPKVAGMLLRRMGNPFVRHEAAHALRKLGVSEREIGAAEESCLKELEKETRPQVEAMELKALEYWANSEWTRELVERRMRRVEENAITNEAIEECRKNFETDLRNAEGARKKLDEMGIPWQVRK